MDSSFWKRIKKQQESTAIQNGLIAYPPAPSLETKEPYKCRLLRADDLEQMCKLLYTEFHYAYLKSTPDMKVDPLWLLNDLSCGAYGVGCYVNDEIIGCVWVRPIGSIGFNQQNPILSLCCIVEHLCIATLHRGKGLTRVLLNWVEVHRPSPETRFIFLKEGKAVPTNHICWDNYIYTRIIGKVVPNRSNVPIIIRKTQAIKITTEKCIEWISANIEPNAILHNIPAENHATSRTQLWLWRDAAIMAITETHQCHPLDGRPIGLVIGWICKKDLGNLDRSMAQEDILKSQPFTWLWSARSYIESNNREWFNDGLVWWQPYLWSANIMPQNLFIIL
jgi:hypothetical protein